MTFISVWWHVTISWGIITSQLSFNCWKYSLLFVIVSINQGVRVAFWLDVPAKWNHMLDYTQVIIISHNISNINLVENKITEKMRFAFSIILFVSFDCWWVFFSLSLPRVLQPIQSTSPCVFYSVVFGIKVWVRWV